MYSKVQVRHVRFLTDGIASCGSWVRALKLTSKCSRSPTMVKVGCPPVAVGLLTEWHVLASDLVGFLHWDAREGRASDDVATTFTGASVGDIVTDLVTAPVDVALRDCEGGSGSGAGPIKEPTTRPRLFGSVGATVSLEREVRRKAHALGQKLGSSANFVEMAA